METRRWRLKGPEMEGPIARWYARVRGSKGQIEAYRKQASADSRPAASSSLFSAA